VSLRGRLLLAVGAVATVALLAADVATYTALRSFLFARVDQSLEAVHFPIERALTGGPPLESTVALLAPGAFVEVRDADDGVLGAIAARERGGRQLTPRLPASIGGLQAPPGPGEPRVYLTVGSMEPGGPDFRVRASQIRGGNQLIIAVPIGETTFTLRRLIAIEAAVTLLALAGAGAAGWWLVRVGLRPLADAESTAEAIARGELHQRVPGENESTEVGRLAGALNTMLGRIEAAIAERDMTLDELRASEERLRRFVADASHELRTPLAAVSAYAELFDRGADERPEDLARVMAGIRAETRRMRRLVEDLLLLARLDEGRPLERAPVDLVDVASEAVEAARAVGPAWPLELDAPTHAVVTGDRERLRQVFDNLLSNVRAHTPAGTRARVRIGLNGRDAVVAVSDEGPGLQAGNESTVFERFFRSDPSRSRRQGGAGLGLSIVQAIVESHDGSVSASTDPHGGAVFSLRIPLEEKGSS
jgi:two-component system OmpR family sensor kinase